MLKSSKFLFVFFLITACTPSIASSQTPVPTTIFSATATEINNLQTSTSTPPHPTSTFTPVSSATKINVLQTSTPRVEDLIFLIYFSDPTLPQYNPSSDGYAAFPKILKQISELRTEDGIAAADDLAIAINFPRPDSYLAAQTLLTLGPNVTDAAIPLLIDNLHSPKPEVRIYSVILLGSIGKLASCSVGDISPLLWDSDSRVRSATALSLEMIIEQDLVSSKYEIPITPSFMANSILEDTPEGKIVGGARNWWNEQGSKINWHPSYGICDP